MAKDYKMERTFYDYCRGLLTEGNPPNQQEHDRLMGNLGVGGNGENLATIESAWDILKRADQRLAHRMYNNL